MQFTYPYAIIKDVHATGEAFRAKKRTSIKRGKFITFFSIFVGFLPSWIRIRIRIANPDPDTDPGTSLNPDSDPQHCLQLMPPPPPRDVAAWKEDLKKTTSDTLLINLNKEFALFGNLNKMRYCLVDSFYHWEGAKSNEEVSFVSCKRSCLDS